MNQSIQELEDFLRKGNLAENKIRTKEIRTGKPRKEYKDDEEYSNLIGSLHEDYKKRIESSQFIREIIDRNLEF